MTNRIEAVVESGFVILVNIIVAAYSFIAVLLKVPLL
jgi:hypothetical protein